ncbi:MAG: flagellar biosynthesis anti-sigma factor FlgM [Chloroflexota bacterium]|nr:MAG: flagellar biosynthesis anti-sigma factor FlgM [Chloroflexota bacterium]
MNLNPIQRDILRAYGNRTRGSQEAGSSAEAGGSGAPEDAAAAPRADGVVLSDTAAIVGRSLSAVRSSPDVRENVVTALRAQVQSGQYNVPAEDIARAIIDSAGQS